jgi:hypothetical protein
MGVPESLHAVQHAVRRQAAPPVQFKTANDVNIYYIAKVNTVSVTNIRRVKRRWRRCWRRRR